MSPPSATHQPASPCEEPYSTSCAYRRIYGLTAQSPPNECRFRVINHSDTRLAIWTFCRSPPTFACSIWPGETDTPQAVPLGVTWGFVAVSYAAVEKYNREHPDGKQYHADEVAAAQFVDLHRYDGSFVCTKEMVGQRIDIVVE